MTVYSDTQIRTLILVNTDYGIKSQDLFLNLGKDGAIRPEQIKKVLLEMVEQGDIVEIEYIRKNVSRSFFLPKGTEVRVK